MRMSALPPKLSLYFCLMVFAFSFFLWLLEEMVGEGTLGLPINLPVSSLMAFFPLVTACIFAYGKEKEKGVRNLFKRVIDLRSSFTDDPGFFRCIFHQVRWGKK